MNNQPTLVDYKALGEYIYHLRTTHEPTLSQQQLANECGLSAPYISLIENGEVKATLETIDAIARRFRLRAGDVIGNSGCTSNPSLAWECDQLVRVICRQGQLRIEVQSDNA